LNNKAGFQFDRYQPIGNTDSEMAFCYLMQKLAIIWNAKTPPDLEQRYVVVKHFAATIREAGIANFIYSDSDYIFIHSHKREDHHQPDKKVFLPGLYALCRHCTPNVKGKDISGLKVNRSKKKKVTLVASVPLSDENWTALDAGELRVLQGGKVIV
jgi:glutamine amidotransferase